MGTGGISDRSASASPVSARRRRRGGAALLGLIAALLLVSPAESAPPSNDLFASAKTLKAATGSYNGTNVEATKEPGEADHAGNPGGASVWYRWTAPATGNVTFDTFGSGFDSLLAVYAGSDLASLTLVAANDDALGWKWTSKVGFAVTAGTTYAIAVDGYSDAGGPPATGTFAVNWTLTGTSVTPANDNFAGAVELGGVGGMTHGSSFGASKEAGEPSHAGNAGGASVWFRWRAPADGVWHFSTPGSSFDTTLGVYTGVSVASLVEVASSDDLAWNDRTSGATFTTTAGTVYSIAVDGKRWPYSGTASGDYNLWWELLGGPPDAPANDAFASARELTGPYGPVTGNNTGAAKEPGEPSHAGNTGGASLWYRWTAPASGPVYFDTPGSSFDTLLAVYRGTGLGDLSVVVANDDIAYNHWWPNTAWSASYVSFTATAGDTYWIAVDGKAGPGGTPATGSVYLDWWLSAPPADAELVAAGDVGSCDGTGDEATGQLVAAYPGATVAPLGDVANPAGTAEEFGCYDASWGFAKPRTRPTPGNREYLSAGAAPYFSYFGQAAGDPAAGYYSYDLGAWHVVALNGNCAEVGGCGPGSPQEIWLRNDLLAHASDCTLAYWHQSLFASSLAATSDVRPLWQALYEYGADVVLGGHAQFYERFAPQSPSGALDPARGIREFVVGTGGHSLHVPGTRAANSVVLDASSFGVLRLILRAGGYDWQFVPVAGGTFVDSGSGTCSLLPENPGAPGAPVPTTSLSATGQLALSWAPSETFTGSGVTYTLEHRDANDPAFSVVAGGLGTGYSFTSIAPEGEGTWIYRTEGVDGARRSGFSASSAAVVVDRTPPSPLVLAADRAPEYAGGGGWWKGFATVSFRDAGDPALADGSPGSGVVPASVNAPVTYSATGTYTASGTVRDQAGNRSARAYLTVNVDGTPPAISVKCPSKIGRGKTGYATYTASDVGSGLATPASGSVRLDTATKGKKKLTVTAEDNVVNAKSATCYYTVR